MRRRRIIAILAILVCAAGIVFMLPTHPQPPPFSITVVHYKNEPAGHITAHVILTNTGAETLYFYGNRADVALLTQNGWVTNCLGAFAMTFNASSLEPGAHSFEQVRLLSGTGAWKISYEARTPSPRERLFNRMPASLRTRAFASGAMRNWVSEGKSEPQKVWSGIFNAQEWFNAHAELEYLSAPLHEVFPASKSPTTQTNLVRARFTLPPLTANAPK